MEIKILLVAAALVFSRMVAGAADANLIEAKDTVAPKEGATPEHRAGLQTLHWEPQAFQVKREPADAKDAGAGCEGCVSFPSPLPCGNAARDTVVLHWHQALGPDGKPLAGKAPAAIVLSPLAPSMLAQADRMAESLSAKGIHAYAMAMPGCGPRDGDPKQDELVESADHAAQATADLRRAHDAVAALPEVNGKIGLEAACFGALAAVPAQGIDNAFDAVVIGFMGGDMKAFFKSPVGGFFTMPFVQAGWTPAQIDALATAVDPMRLAARVDPAKVVYYTFKTDGLWPKSGSDLLAKEMNLAADHHVELKGTHMELVAHFGRLEKKLQQMLREDGARESKLDTQKPVGKP